MSAGVRRQLQPRAPWVTEHTQKETNDPYIAAYPGGFPEAVDTAAESVQGAVDLIALDTGLSR
jgi:hypothetical protein